MIFFCPLHGQYALSSDNEIEAAEENAPPGGTTSQYQIKSESKKEMVRKVMHSEFPFCGFSGLIASETLPGLNYRECLLEGTWNSCCCLADHPCVADWQGFFRHSSLSLHDRVPFLFFPFCGDQQG